MLIYVYYLLYSRLSYPIRYVTGVGCIRYCPGVPGGPAIGDGGAGGGTGPAGAPLVGGPGGAPGPALAGAEAPPELS